jgi:ferric-chelate reductase
MSSAKPVASPVPKQVDVPALAFHIDMLLLGLFALYVLSTLPRAVIRLFHPSEAFSGFFLRSAARSSAQRTAPLRSESTRTLIREDALSRSNTATTLHGHVPPLPASKYTGGEERNVTPGFPALVTPVANRSRRTKASYVPTRVPRWTTVVHPSLACALNFRVSAGFSLRRLLVLMTYSVIVLYACLYRSNPFQDPNRWGYIAVSQIPIVVALANKSNWLSWLSGVGYEKLNYMHRFSGGIVVIASNVHTLGHVYKAAISTGGLQAKLRIPMFTWGLVAVCALDLLFVTSLFLRNRAYSLFFATHIICIVVGLVAIHKHYPLILPYLITAVVLYGFDHIARIAQTRYTTAWLTAEHMLNGGTTLVNVPSLGAGWRAGQHVRIRVIGDSWFGWLTWLVGRARPFSITTGPNSGGKQLAIKAQGAWTRKLLRMAAGAGNDAKEKPFEVELGREPARPVRMIIEGPYSGPGYTLYTAYSGVMLVAGGSGISYVMGVLQDILRKHAAGQSNVRVVEVVWCIADPDSLYSLLPVLTPLMQPRPSPRAELSLRFSVHWTRASALSPQVLRMTLPSGMYLHVGRPNIRATLQGVIEGVRDAYSSTASCCRCRLESPTGVAIGSCGPTSLIDNAVGAVNRVSWADWIDIGGVESIEEVFGW